MDAEILLPAHLQIFAVATVGALLLWVLLLVRTRRLSLRDSLLWVLLTGSALGLVLFPRGLGLLARAVGAEVPANALFALGFVYVLASLLGATISISATARRQRRLVQECALLRGELAELRARVEGSAAAGPPTG